jgi:TDG/mug DNA glycosylase family protein
VEQTWRPTPDQIRAADGRTVPDVIGQDLKVLFCGINPGRYSGAVGHHFARPGNRFWKALHAAGFTPRVLSSFEERALLDYGLGVTNLVERTTASAAELPGEELEAGARRLRRKVGRLRPEVVALLGLTAFRAAFRRPEARVGRQPDQLAGSMMWVLPNPSGLNAHYQLEELAGLFKQLREEVFG